MKGLLPCLTAILLIGCAAVQTPLAQSAADSPVAQDSSPMPKLAPLPDLGPAPELGNTTWLNVAAPLRLADLQNKVVIIDMWTFG
jgi:hypothetical protein